MTFLIQILSIFQSNWLLYACLGVVLIIQMWLLLKDKSLSRKRLWIRTGLNLFVWILLILFVFQPEWKYTSDTNKVLLIDNNVPKAYIQKIQDSLHISESFSNADFNRLITKNPHLIDKLGNIYLLGQNFSAKTIGQLSQKNLVWLPYFGNNQLQNLQWKSIVHQGEMQEVSGKISVDEPQTLNLKYANKTLDSLQLQKGLNAFRLSFPAFSVGRTEAVLTLANEPLQDIHFYSRAPQSFNVLFILENPDFESKNLSEWLGKNGHKVEIITTIAKDAQSIVSINKSTQTKGFTADIVISDPSNANHALVKKAVADGKSVLFINSAAPEQDIKNINQALGTNWRVKKTSNEQSVSVGDNLTALPYSFEENINQKSLGSYPISIQKKVGKVGLSLLNETFPLKLSGDSLGYSRIWASVFQQLNPPSQDNVIVQAPVFANTQTPIVLNNLSTVANTLTIANDTTQLSQSAVNPLSFSANYIFRKTGWQSFQDSLSIFVEEKNSTLQQSETIQATLRAHQRFEAVSTLSTAQTISATLPDWLWFVLIILGLAALWLEPKLNF